jgi:signal transduction histidine kinase
MSGYFSSALYQNAPGMAAHSDEADNHLFSCIRLMLAVSALLIATADYAADGRRNGAVLVVLSGYLAACVAGYAGTCRQWPWARGKLMHRLDAGACAAMAATGGQADIFPLVFLFFAILAASLRYGLEEGARVTLVAVMLYCAGVIEALPGAAPARLFLRAALLLAFGRALAQLGEWHIQAARRQALLGDLNQVANPRFGIDRTMTAALERTRLFFGADSCIVLLEGHDSGHYAIRAVREGAPPVMPAAPIDAALARTMLPELPAQVLLCVPGRRRWGPLVGAALGHAGGPGMWMRLDPGRMQDLAALLEAGSFISAPLAFACGSGRIFVTAGARRLGRGDALFLARIAARELLAIDRIDFLDRIATDAAAQERKKIGLDLHDTAIQSYIGLQLGLAALCRTAAPSDPLSDDLGKLSAMAAGVIVELRACAARSRGGAVAEEAFCLAALHRQAAQARAAYGIDVCIDIEGKVVFGDRLSAEVLQIVSEGISNVCRHTAARRAGVLLRCTADTLRIEISNEHGAAAPPAFRPRSISERASALGGSAFVRQGRFNNTIVCVEIPL